MHAPNLLVLNLQTQCNTIRTTNSKIKYFFPLFVSVSCFKTGLEPGLLCYQCVGTHPGCGLHDFDWKWYWGKICPRSDDRCVKVCISYINPFLRITSAWFCVYYVVLRWLSGRALTSWWPGTAWATWRVSAWTSRLTSTRVVERHLTTSNWDNIRTTGSKNWTQKGEPRTPHVTEPHADTRCHCHFAWHLLVTVI